MQKSVLSLVSAVAAANLKVGVTSDPHYNAYYSPTSSANHCLSTTEANDVYAPVAGTVVAVNDALVATPELLNTDPYGAGWICDIEISEVNESELMSPEQYSALIGV